jgi:putative Mg2+ transporter-C (MgtC) family protein
MREDKHFIQRRVSFGYGQQYFTEYTRGKVLFYLLAIVYVSSVCVVVAIVEPFLQSVSLLPCVTRESNTLSSSGGGKDEGGEQFKHDGPNPFYVDDACRYTRYARLLGLNKEECIFGRRLVVSVVLGGIIGWERRHADRPAGIRTMSLVSLGSSLFTICSAYAFLSGPMTWDASRISAAIPSGVGFLGAGLIWKEAQRDAETGNTSHTVHGLTTAASLWLSSAVGIACGGGLFFAASFATAIILVLLRFGPRLTDYVEESSEHNYNNDNGNGDNEEGDDEAMSLNDSELDEEEAGDKVSEFYGSTLCNTAATCHTAISTSSMLLQSPLRLATTMSTTSLKGAVSSSGNLSIGSQRSEGGPLIQRKNSGLSSSRLSSLSERQNTPSSQSQQQSQRSSTRPKYDD